MPATCKLWRCSYKSVARHLDSCQEGNWLCLPTLALPAVLLNVHKTQPKPNKAHIPQASTFFFFFESSSTWKRKELSLLYKLSEENKNHSRPHLEWKASAQNSFGTVGRSQSVAKILKWSCEEIMRRQPAAVKQKLLKCNLNIILCYWDKILADFQRFFPPNCKQYNSYPGTTPEKKKINLGYFPFRLGPLLLSCPLAPEYVAFQSSAIWQVFCPLYWSKNSMPGCLHHLSHQSQQGDKRWPAGTISLQHCFKGEIPEPVSKGTENKVAPWWKQMHFRCSSSSFFVIVFMVITNRLLRMKKVMGCLKWI